MSSTIYRRPVSASGRQSGSGWPRRGGLGAALVLGGAVVVGAILARGPDAAVPAAPARSDAASSAVGPDPRPDRDPLLASEDSAVGELRLALRMRGFPDDLSTGAMQALRYDPARTLEGDEGEQAWPRGAWLVQSQAGRWLVWRLGTATPADDVARRADACAPRAPVCLVEGAGGDYDEGTQGYEWRRRHRW